VIGEVFYGVRGVRDRNGFTSQIFKDMEETRDDSGPAEQGPSNSVWWGSDFIEKFESVSLLSQEDTLRNKESHKNYEEDGLSSQTASQVLWSTGMLSEQIPNGFYSVIPVRIDLLFNFCSYLFVASSFG
jgi:hypothetical protein